MSVTLPPPPQESAVCRKLASGFLGCYTRVRSAAVDHLRTAWEEGRKLDALLAEAKAEGVPVKVLLHKLREDRSNPFNWSYPTVRAYAQLSREPWPLVKASGSVRKALADMRDRNRTPEQLELTRETRRSWKDRALAAEKRVAVLERRIEALERELASLRRSDNALSLEKTRGAY